MNIFVPHFQFFLFAELFLPDDIGENGEGFNLGSIINLNNLGSLSNLELLSGLFRSNNDEEIDEYEEDYDEIDDNE